MTDFEKCKAALDKVGACYFTKFGENNTNKLVCYSPYVSYNFEKDEVEIHCYVYHWVDTYDADGNFISHEVYEAAYTEELDYGVWLQITLCRDNTRRRNEGFNKKIWKILKNII